MTSWNHSIGVSGGGEGGVDNEEEKFREWIELDCPAMSSALSVLAGIQAELEYKDDRVSGVSGLLVGGCVGG